MVGEEEEREGRGEKRERKETPLWKKTGAQELTMGVKSHYLETEEPVFPPHRKVNTLRIVSALEERQLWRATDATEWLTSSGEVIDITPLISVFKSHGNQSGFLPTQCLPCTTET